MFLIHLDFELLSTILVWLRPVVIILFGDLALTNNPLELADDQRTQFN